MKTKTKVGLLLSIQISAIFFTVQYLESENQSDQSISIVQQGISQTNPGNLSQNEKFGILPINKEPVISDSGIFVLVSSFSSIVLIIGVTKILKTESIKKNEKEKLTILGELATRIAHDMRNPLSVIQMTLENFKKQYELTEEQEKQFEKIHRSIFRMTHQIDDIWDFIKSPAINKKFCSLDTILQDSIAHINIPSEIKIHLPSKDCKILCDAEVIPVVFLNIFTNAIQELGNKGNIWVSFNSDKKWTVVKIEDDGNGIKPEILDKVFEPLVTSKQSGTGLGLASCKSIMETHGGFIKASNSSDKGAVFSIHFPKK